MLPRRATSALACLLAAALLAAGCGGGSDLDRLGGGAAAEQAGAAEERLPGRPKAGRWAKSSKRPTPTPNSSSPRPRSSSTRARTATRSASSTPIAARSTTPRSPSTSAKVPPVEAGRRRDAEAASREGRGRPRPAPKRSNSRRWAPIPAAIESLATKPAFRAQTTTSDPDAATVVYTTDIDFPSNGEWRIAALIKQGDETAATLLPSATVGEFKACRRWGEKAPKIHTPTPADVGGDLSKITTRIPPDTQNRVDYADALGKEPIFLLFATPQFCQSRVCGPVVDVAEQVKEQYGDKAAFIHMEIYKDNDPSKGVRPQVRAFHLPSEPWLFAIDRKGVIRRRSRELSASTA